MSLWTRLSLVFDPEEKFSPEFLSMTWPAVPYPACLSLRGDTSVKAKMGIDRSVLPWAPKLPSCLKLRGRNSCLQVKSETPALPGLPASVPMRRWRHDSQGDKLGSVWTWAGHRWTAMANKPPSTWLPDLKSGAASLANSSQEALCHLKGALCDRC